MDSMLATGAARIGTLVDYRNAGEHGELVGDTLEGSKLLAGTILNLNAEKAKQFPGLEGLIEINGGFIGTLEVSNYVRSIVDALIFSASREYSEEAHRRWHEAKEYDCCYRILSARLFFKSLTEAVGSDFTFIGFADVVYSEQIDIAKPEAGTHPALVKRNVEHNFQNEVRAIWHPSLEQPVSPIILLKSRANTYCERYKKIS